VLAAATVLATRLSVPSARRSGGLCADRVLRPVANALAPTLANYLLRKQVLEAHVAHYDTDGSPDSIPAKRNPLVHPRVYGRGQFVFNPKHYLALLDQKPGALDQAAPLQKLDISGTAPASAATLGSPHSAVDSHSQLRTRRMFEVENACQQCSNFVKVYAAEQ